MVQAGSSLEKKIGWALSKEKILNRLIEDTTELVDSLVELFPTAKSVQERLYGDDGNDLASSDAVSLLMELVDRLDPLLFKALKSQNSQRGDQFNISFGANNQGVQTGYVNGSPVYNFGITR